MTDNTPATVQPVESYAGQEVDPGTHDLTGSQAMTTIMDPQKMHQLIQAANMMANSGNMVPAHFQGKPDSCAAVIMQAMRWGMDPTAVASQTFMVSGTLGYGAQLVNAVVTSSKAIEGRFHFRYGDKHGVYDDEKYQDSHRWVAGKNKEVGADKWVQCGAMLKGEDIIQWGERLYPDEVKTKNSPLWITAVKQQAAYLAVKYWARIYCPQVIMGVYSNDEIPAGGFSRNERSVGGGSAISRPPARQAIASPQQQAEAVQEMVQQGEATAAAQVADKRQEGYDSIAGATFAQLESDINEESDDMQLRRIYRAIKDNPAYPADQRKDLESAIIKRSDEIKRLAADAEDNGE